ncbi:MAG: sensor histidine kinase [Caulobacteraceae bacterium]
MLGSIQSFLAFRREALERDVSLEAASLRSAATVRARLESAEILLQTLAPTSVGIECAQRLAEVKERIPGYANLIRFDSIGRVACSAATTPPDPARRDQGWFSSLREGERMRVVRDPDAAYSAEPAVLTAVRAERADGSFDGALVAVITLQSLRPEVADPTLPRGAEVALAEAGGGYLNATRATAFPGDIAERVRQMRERPSLVWFEADARGEERVFSAARLLGEDVFVILSAPAPSIFSWAILNPLTSLALPVLAFLLALIAVLLVTERGVLRWIAYLQRVAEIYARGRFSVHPIKADTAPPEFAALARTLDEMAATISARDASLMESLAEKDDLMREIHHRVKNNLQVVTSLLNLQQRALTDASARAAISDTRQRIGALALIYRQLYQGPDLKRLDLRDFLEELLAQLLIGEAPAGPHVETELDAESVTIDADRLAPLSLFAVEAISNARKHGLSEGGALKLTFEVHNGLGELAISDTGREGQVPELGQGVGRTLMTAFAKQLRGTSSFTPNEDGGLTARLSFPIAEPQRAPVPKAATAPAGAPAQAESRNPVAAKPF